MLRIGLRMGRKGVSAMKKVLGVLLVGCLLAALPFTFTACGGDGGGATTGGQLPTFEVGDSWSWSYAMQGQDYTLSEEVIGEERVEGRDCYVTDMSFDPLLTFPQAEGVSTVSGMTYWGDKATAFYEVKREMAGYYDGTDFTITMIFDYSSWASLFPLAIGKEVATEQTVTQYFDGSQSGEPTVSAQRYRVDSQGSVTVPAGTFSCWKLIIYDGEGNILQTVWWSDEVKSVVKSVDGNGNTVMELLSYSVS
jgi:hypothetical protein